MAEQEKIAPWAAIYTGKSMPGSFQHGETYLVTVSSGFFGAYAVRSESFPGEEIEYFELVELRRDWRLPTAEEGGPGNG